MLSPRELAKAAVGYIGAEHGEQDNVNWFFKTYSASIAALDEPEEPKESVAVGNCATVVNALIAPNYDRLLADLVRKLATETTETGERGCIISSADMGECLRAQLRACGMFAIDENGYGYGLVKKHPLGTTTSAQSQPTPAVLTPKELAKHLAECIFAVHDFGLYKELCIKYGYDPRGDLDAQVLGTPRCAAIDARWTSRELREQYAEPSTPAGDVFCECKAAVIS